VPLAVLAAILVFIGFKLCRPKVWGRVAHIGLEQLFIFATTVLVTVTTDLLIGIIVGILLELLLNLFYVGLWHSLRDGDEFARPGLFARFASLFRNPVAERECEGDAYHLYLNGPMVCFNLFHLLRELQNRPHDSQEVHVHLSSHVPVVDHTTGESLHHFLEEFSGEDGTPRLVIEGWDHMRPLSKHETSTRLALSTVNKNLADGVQTEEELRVDQATD
jgi:MFS superfamily sulfate permease-like transporter